MTETIAARPDWLRKEATPGALKRDVIAPSETIRGFFNEDDCMHFYLLLRSQTLHDLTGDIFEIGPYFGKSTALLAHCLQPDETLVVCDAFGLPIADKYAHKPTLEDVRQSIRHVNADFDFAQLEIHNCLSTDLDLPPERRFRFAHIDGAHDADTALHDIRFAADRMLSRGIIAIDDYEHPDWPEVTIAADRFLDERGGEFTVLADMNRHIAKGRKLYLARRA